jgi:hypothetical protein
MKPNMAKVDNTVLGETHVCEYKRRCVGALVFREVHKVQLSCQLSTVCRTVKVEVWLVKTLRHTV